MITERSLGVRLQTSHTPIVDSLTKRIHREDEVMEDLDEDASFKILRHMLSCRRTLLKKHGLPFALIEYSTW